MRLDQIGLQLYTVRRLAADDLPATLRAVAAAGYRSVELAGLPEMPPAELRRLLDEAGLRPVSAHQDLDRLRSDTSAVADWLDVLGCPRVVVPWLPEDLRRTADDVRALAVALNGVARQLADRGIRLGYHNHNFEFAPLDGTTIWDVLVGEFGPGIDFEVDVYWASLGGRDPAAEIRNLGDRVRLLHMKDRAPGPDPHDAPAGSGILDFAAIVEAGRASGVEWYLAEQDEPVDELSDIATARGYLEPLAVP